MAMNREEIVERADLEEQTVDEVLAILSAEFERNMNKKEIKSDKIVNKRWFYRDASKRYAEVSRISGVFRLL